ncbi:hypothetical protein PVAND_002949 [Polypedilum vanderplanki]|uniref:Galectin n=1 Tax=Polypedilum vanderplanki TaxID=319348 RepID=A0A9J6BSL4_POLVA|nr:hypothetical protein PVAND_002949 [Polypedilum vanderplanki]
MFNFTEVLSDFVKVGHVFVISGYSNDHANSLSVLLSTGKSNDANVALSLVSNFSQNRIIRSAFVNGSFVGEETSDNMNLMCENPMPLKVGQQFTFCILVGDDRFHIAINDNPFCTYKYQMPVQQIRSLIVMGDVESLVKVNHMQMFPYIFPNIRSDYDELAFEGFIPREYSPGSLVTVGGIVNGKSDGEFTIMFVEDETTRQLVHFNVRFDEQCVVMNSMVDEEGWSDNEIRSDHMPIYIGQPFKVGFAFTNSQVKVAVNGSHLMDFPLSAIEMEENESLWSNLTGFRVKNGADMNVQINSVEHIQMNNENCNDFESYCIL